MRLHEIAPNYDRAAPKYDRWTDMVSGWLGLEGHRERTVELLGDLTGATALDLGCGTGRSLRFLVPRVGPQGQVFAVDYSQGMLAEARDRVEEQGWENVALLQCDAVQLEGVPEVDAVLAVWCLGIVYDLDAALKRAVSLLRPGGRIAIMDFHRSRPDHGMLRWLFPLYSAVLQRAGIDTEEDMNDAQLQAKWRAGKALLRAELVDMHEETYLHDLGFILAGTKPS